jgi:hypothetical protein
VTGNLAEISGIEVPTGLLIGGEWTGASKDRPRRTDAVHAGRQGRYRRLAARPLVARSG